MATGDETIGEVGEWGLIAAVARDDHDRDLVPVGPGDDAALVRAPAGGVLVATDTMVEGRHFRRDWSEPYDVGRRAAAANLADIAAMGGTATALVVSFAAPGDLPASWATELARGLDDEAAVVGASVVGGDVTAADQVVVGVTVLGGSAHPPVLRSGACAGQVVAYAGRLGWAEAGVRVLGRGFRSPRVVVEAHRRPDPPYAEGPRAAAAGAGAMIDVSDGLLGDLGHVAAASGVVIDLDASSLEVPEPLATVGAALGIDPLELMLTGGDDHALVATFAPGSVPDGWHPIGRVLAPDTGGDTVPGDVTVDGVAYESESRGHRHYA